MLEFLLVVLLATLIMVLSFAIVAFFVMPVSGALVRLRANYLPKGVALSDAKDVNAEAGDARVGPVVRRVWSMVWRVKRLEGWKGLYKGISPFLALNFIISVCTIAFVGGSATVTPKGTYQVPSSNGLSMTLFGLFTTFIALPLNLVMQRSIVTPHLLPWSPRAAARIILTPFERAHPFKLFLAPGLLAVTAAHIFFLSVISHGIKNLLVPELRDGLFKEPLPGHEGEEPEMVKVRMWRLGVFVVFQALSTLILCPLEVLAVRLAIQRQNGPTGTPTDQIPSSYAAEEEDVIALRSEDEQPYEGVVDAVKTIVAEEGWQTLYTAWPVTLAGLVLGTAV